MIINCTQLNTDYIDNSDICIVGGGPAGITLAQKLSQNNSLKISIIESGGLSFNVKIQKLNTGECSALGNYPHINYSILNNRIRQFGGTSNVWAGWCGPLEKTDFHEKSWVQNSGWPISYNDLEPFYKESQSILNLSRFIYNKDVYKYYPKAYANARLKEFKNIFWQFSSPPLKFNHKYFNLFKEKNNVKLFLKGTISDLTKVNNKITEISCMNDSIKIKFKSKIFILACGAIENAAILLNFQKKNPQDNFINKNVGKYFMEHPHCTIGYGYTKSNNKNFTYCYSQNRIKILDNNKFLSGITILDEMQEKNKINNCISVFLPHNFLEVQSAIILRGIFALKAVNFNIITLFVKLFKDAKKIYTNIFDILKNFISKKKKFYIVARIEQAPIKDNKVYLSKIKNKYGNYFPILDWRLTEQDLKTLSINFNEIKLNLEKNNVADVYPSDFIKTIQNKKINTSADVNTKIFTRKIYATGHHMGTTRMGNNNSISVVDKNLKIHEIDNLYCAGSSVFTTSGSINPTLTIVALSLRLADYLEKKILN